MLSYLREKDREVYILKDSVEYLYIDFNKAISDKWQHPFFPQRYKYIVSKSDTILTDAGMFYNCIQVVDESDIDIHREWYASGIGLVKVSLTLKEGSVSGGVHFLLNAVISGDKIP